MGRYSARQGADNERGKHHEIKVRYAWQARQRKGEITKKRRTALHRLNELERLFIARNGLDGDIDAARHYIEIVAHHIAHLGGEVENHILCWCTMRAPWFPADEAQEIAETVSARRWPRKWTALSLGNELKVTPEERQSLKIDSFRPAGWSKKRLNRAAKERRKLRERERRKRIAKAEGRILRARPGRPRKITGTDIRAPQSLDIMVGMNFRQSSAVADQRVVDMKKFRRPSAPDRSAADLWRSAYGFLMEGGMLHPSQAKQFKEAGYLTKRGKVTALGKATGQPATSSTVTKEAA